MSCNWGADFAIVEPNGSSIYHDIYRESQQVIYQLRNLTVYLSIVKTSKSFIIVV